MICCTIPVKKISQVRGEALDVKILSYLETLPLTATTEMVAREAGIAWYTAQSHLYRLKDGGRVELFRIGRQNQWILSERARAMRGASRK